MLFLDTATRYTGYALFLPMKDDPSTVEMGLYGILKAKGNDRVDRCRQMAKMVRTLLLASKPGMLMMEYPEFQAGSKGMAASRGSTTIHLGYLCGLIDTEWQCLVDLVKSVDSISEEDYVQGQYQPAKLVRPSQWKGQLTKAMTCERCAKHFNLPVPGNPDSIENNWVDAVMIGRWYVEKKLMLKAVCLQNKAPVRHDLEPEDDGSVTSE